MSNRKAKVHQRVHRSHKDKFFCIILCALCVPTPAMRARRGGRVCGKKDPKSPLLHIAFQPDLFGHIAHAHDGVGDQLAQLNAQHLGTFFND